MINGELIVDNFAGGGGNRTGKENLLVGQMNYRGKFGSSVN